MSHATPPRPPKRLVVFCDGTWVGRETKVAGAPSSNILQLANMVGEVQYSTDPAQKSTEVHRIRPHAHTQTGQANGSARHGNPFLSNGDPTTIVAGYQEGVGVNRTFLDYIWDGATASSIGDECISVYRFIVENFTDDHEIWLFGFSRGAFTVRCVAGMINNCGIVKKHPEYDEDDLQRLCFDVFRTYRSDLPADEPHSRESEQFKGNAQRVWQVKRPIRYMGIIDTVGALGIPRLSAGVGIDWAPFEFFNKQVSSVVQHVYHAPSLHDRFWFFQPCLVYPGSSGEKAIIHQKWFPGTHYDLGRQAFRFVRQSPTNWIEGALGWLPDLLSKTIYPNEVLGDCVLRWLLEGVRDVDDKSPNPIIPDTKIRINALTARIASPAPNTTGSGDIYGDVVNYVPVGIILSPIQRASRFFTSALNSVVPRLGDNLQDLLGIKTIIGILTATTDRRIPSVTADIFPYKDEQMMQVNGQERSIAVVNQAKMTGKNEWGKDRYPSQTYEAHLLWRRVFGRQGTGADGS